MAPLAAEFLGTFWLVLGGCGSAVIAAAFPESGIGFTGVSLAFGLTVLTGAYALDRSRAVTSIRRYRSGFGPAGAFLGRGYCPTSSRSCWVQSSPPACST